MASWFCYLLRCADDTLYCGITNDLDKRLAAHNAGTASKCTRVRLPVVLAYAEPCEDKSAALKREMQIKRMPRSEKLKLNGVVGRVSDSVTRQADAASSVGLRGETANPTYASGARRLTANAENQ